MMIMSATGGQPAGELFQTPLDGDESWLIGQYYRGTDIKLLQFRRPLSSPEDGSPMDRIYNLEDMMPFILERLHQVIDVVNSALGSNIPNEDIPPMIADWNAFIASRDSLLQTDSPFMIRNVELLSSQRGW